MSKFYRTAIIKIIESNLWERLVNIDTISLIEEAEDNKTLIHIVGVGHPVLLEMDYLDFTNWIMDAGDVLNPQAPIGVC